MNIEDFILKSSNPEKKMKVSYFSLLSARRYLTKRRVGVLVCVYPCVRMSGNIIEKLTNVLAISRTANTFLYFQYFPIIFQCARRDPTLPVHVHTLD